MTANLAGPPLNVVFDFGGVLIRWDPEAITARYFPDNLIRERVRLEIFNHPDWIELDCGTLSEEVAAERFATRTGRSVAEMEQFLAHVRDSLTPIEESFSLVRRLHARGVALYGLSNMPSRTFAQLQERYPIWSPFSGILISGDIGVAKPDRGIFDHLCRSFGLKPAETLFIDDHPANIESARLMGFRTLLFANPRQCAKELGAVIQLG